MSHIFHRSIFEITLVLLTAFFWIACMPPFKFSEFAYFLFSPLLIWFCSAPNKKSFFRVVILIGGFAWIGILIWLRHVTWGGTILLSIILSLYFVLWATYTRYVMPRIYTRPFVVRLIGFLGISGCWVVLEYLRSILLYGMPMGPFALSQWERPVVLQLAAWTGAYGISFFLILFNCCLALTFQQLINKDYTGKLFRKWFKVDFYFAIISLIGLLFLYAECLPKSVSKKSDGFTFGIIQPNFEPLLIWNAENNKQRMMQLKSQLQAAKLLDFDILFFPEAVTPNPIIGDLETLRLFENFADEKGQALVLGNLAYDDLNDAWYNGIFLVEPEKGLAPSYYTKRQLVPFGEYTPKLFSWIEPFGGIQGSFMAGNEPKIIPFNLGERTWSIGPLVCYEDMFPSLVRNSVNAGSEILFVATNDSWYGEEGGAYFHAAHSVLRAVENRRPVVRCGNAGWSGWIDPLGLTRGIMLDNKESIYFKGSGNFEFKVTEEWDNFESFYSKNGDWFVCVAFFLAIIGISPCITNSN